MVESARAMLHDAGLPNSYWADAVKYAAHICNSVPTRALSGSTPYEAWCGNSPDVSRFRIFGCKAFVHVPDEKRRKLDSKTVECIFIIGYVTDKRAYHCIDRPTGTVYKSQDVIFDKGVMLSAGDGPRAYRGSIFSARTRLQLMCCATRRLLSVLEPVKLLVFGMHTQSPKSFYRDVTNKKRNLILCCSTTPEII